METENKQLSFPYVSYPTFKAFISHLHNNVVTEQIDNSMMPQNMSGSARGAIISALKSLGLIDTQNNTTQKLKDLAKAYDTKEWPEAVRKNILSAYTNITGNINLKSVTRKQVDNLFADITQQMKDKCIRFFLSANKEAGVEYSPLLKIRRRVSGGKKRNSTITTPKTQPDESTGKQSDEMQKNSIKSNGSVDLPLLIPSEFPCFIRVPKDITVSQVAIVKAAVDYIETMAKQNEEIKK